MKKLILLGASLAAVGLIAPANAQTHSATTTSSSTAGYIQSSKIIGSKIRSADGSEVGVIKDVVLDRSTGCMAYTILETSDGSNVASSGGSRSSTTTTTRKTVAVPYTAFQTTSDPTVYTTTIQRERIYSAPAYDYNRVEEYSRPEYIGGVYSYYGVQPSVGVNINVGTSGGRTGMPTQPGYGASATPSATPIASVSPIASAMPSASPTASASATASLAPSASASPRAIMSPTPMGTAMPKATAAASVSATAKPSATNSSAASAASPAVKAEHSHSSSAITTMSPAVKGDTGAAATQSVNTDESSTTTSTSKGDKKPEKGDKAKKAKGSAEPETTASPSEP